MDYTHDELKKKTVAELREIAKTIEHEAVQGHTQMNKEHLLNAICKALGIDTRKHHVAAAPNKDQTKAKIKELKKKKEELIAAHNHKELKLIHRRIHHLKRQLRKMVV